MKNDHFRGVHIDKETDTILRLYAKKAGVSVSQLLRRVISDWKEYNELTVFSLINDVAASIQAKWEHIQVFDKKFPKSVFIAERRKELSSLPPNIVNLIIACYEENQRSANK
jgi:hypothetical protein